MNEKSKTFLECLDICGCINVKDGKKTLSSNDLNDQTLGTESVNEDGFDLNGAPSDTPFADAIQTFMNEEGLKIFHNSVDSFNKGSCHMKLLIDKLMKGDCVPRRDTTTQINHKKKNKKFGNYKNVVRNKNVRNDDYMNVIDLENEIIINSNQTGPTSRLEKCSFGKTTSPNPNSSMLRKNTSNSSMVSRLDSANVSQYNHSLIEKSQMKHEMYVKQKVKEDPVHIKPTSIHKNTKIPEKIIRKVSISNTEEKKANPIKTKKTIVSTIPKDSLHKSEAINQISNKFQTSQEMKIPLKSHQAIRTASFTSIRQLSNLLEEMPSNVSSDFYSAFSSMDTRNIKFEG